MGINGISFITGNKIHDRFKNFYKFLEKNKLELPVL